MASEVIWMRVGDQDDYHEFDTLEDAAQYLADFYRLERIDRYKKYGVCAEGFTGNNYISLYWGLPDPGDGTAEAIRELTDQEIEKFNESLEACADCGLWNTPGWHQSKSFITDRGGRMSRKVSFDVVAEVQVKVRVKIPMTFRWAEGDQHRISFAHAIKLTLKNKQHPSADFEDALSVEEILSVDDQDQADDYTDLADWLQEAVQEKVSSGQAKYIDATVTDSRWWTTAAFSLRSVCRRTDQGHSDPTQQFLFCVSEWPESNMAFYNDLNNLGKLYDAESRFRLLLTITKGDAKALILSEYHAAENVGGWTMSFDRKVLHELPCEELT